MRKAKNIFANIDLVTIVIYLMLVLFGWVNIYASQYNDDILFALDFSSRYGKQFYFIIISLVAALIILIIDWKFYYSLSYIIYGIIIFSLCAVLIIGGVTNGAVSWFQIGSIKIQPSEMAKFATALALARFFNMQHIKEQKINGINVTVPFKKEVIPYLDELTEQAKKTQSVNTIYLGNNGITGHNTDIEGFEESLKYVKYDVRGKDVLILGGGGVVPSIIFALKNMQAQNIIISNRTREKAENLKKIFENIKIMDWGNVPDVDMIINATSIGLKLEDRINLDYSKIKNKFFYDVIYNPSETDFLKSAKKFGNSVVNGKMMFIYQALYAFKLWHNLTPKINDEVIRLLDND